MNRIALVTGGAQGLGYAIAERLLADGFQVAIGDINGEGAQRAVHKLGTDRASAHFLDVTVDLSVETMFDAVLSQWGGISVLVNNAGVITRSAAEESNSDQWLRDLDVNLGGVMRCSRAAFSALRADGAGTIINIGSVGTTLGMPLRLAYSTAKAGIGGFTRTLAAEWGCYGIRVNAIAPGYIDTEMMNSGFRLGVLDEFSLIRRTPLRRLGDASEIAGAVSFLTSPDSSFITGVVLPVDGGITISGDFRPEQDDE